MPVSAAVRLKRVAYWRKYASLVYWHSMLEALPADEAKHPGNVNGFCL